MFSVDFDPGDIYNAVSPVFPGKDAMVFKRLTSLMLWGFSTAALACVGCEDTVKFKNTAPEQLNIVPEKCFVAGGATIRLIGTAVDADGDSLTFRWSAPQGSFIPPSATNDTVYWKAPANPGTVRITMSVTDEIATRTAYQDITVCSLLPSQYLMSTTIPNEGYLYITKGDTPIRVAGSVTLTISPGVTIIMDRTIGGIECQGRIVAQGTPTQRITIKGNTCGAETGLWKGIYFIGKSSHGTFRYCDITAGMDGVTAREEATLVLADCEIYNHEGFGANVSYSSSADIRNCRIWDNGDGIYVNDSQVSVRRCSIRYSDGEGVVCIASQDTMQASFDSCVVANNYKNGFLLEDRAAPAIHYCSIFANRGAGAGTYAVKLIANVSPEPIHAENNYWGLGNDTEEEISGIIYDKNDNPAAIFAQVLFVPWLNEAPAAKGASTAHTSRLGWAR